MSKYYDTIGVIGGMGSYSTLYFFKKFLDLFDVEEEYERPRIIIDNYCTLPNKVKAYLYGENREELLSQIILSLQGLRKMGCTKSLILCNTAHAFVEEILDREAELKGYLMDVLDCLSQKLYQNGVGRTLVWATRNTIKTGIFDNYLRRWGIDVEYDIDHNEAAIHMLMLAGEKNLLNGQVESQYNRLCKMYDRAIPVVLGCTELSVVHGTFKSDDSLTIYDPIECVLENIFKNLHSK